MAPTIKPKKPLKSMEKLIDKPVLKKKPKKKNFTSYALYIYQVLRTIHQDMGISRQAMSIMNSFVLDMTEKIAGEAAKLVAQGKKTTMGSRDIEAAVKLVVPGDLATHCKNEALKAMIAYKKSKEMPD